MLARGDGGVNVPRPFVRRTHDGDDINTNAGAELLDGGKSVRDLVVRRQSVGTLLRAGVNGSNAKSGSPEAWHLHIYAPTGAYDAHAGCFFRGFGASCRAHESYKWSGAARHHQRTTMP